MLSGCATSYAVNPIAGSPDTVRYDHGVPTLTADLKQASIEVTPLGFNSAGQILFGVAVLNTGGSAAEFGRDNVALSGADGHALHVFGEAEIERRARNRARAATAVTLVAGALVAYGAASSAHYDTHGYVRGPGGGARVSLHGYDAGAAYAGVGVAAAGTALGAVAIHDSLEHTLASLHGQILERTTVGPGDSTGGLVVGQRPNGDLPWPVDLKVSWRGETHDFRFTVTSER